MTEPTPLNLDKLKEMLGVDSDATLYPAQIACISSRDEGVATIDGICNQAKMLARKSFKHNGFHHPMFTIMGPMNPETQQTCECKQHTWVVSVINIDEEMSKEKFENQIKFVKHTAKLMQAYCIVSMAEIGLTVEEDGLDGEALNVQVEHQLGDRRFMAQLVRTHSSLHGTVQMRNPIIRKWEEFEPDPPVPSLQSMLPTFSNAEEV